MSKGNMLFSQARGKVGDLVFSRLDGEQIVRSRNRHPKNPKTNAQLYQRAIMATVLRAYSAGKMIFDHAFEGKQVGAQCQRAFLSLNAKRLRAAIAADIEAGHVGADCTARVVAPGVNSPVGAAFIVSDGSLVQNVFSDAGQLNGVGNVDNETIGAYMTRKGIQQNDLFTLVAFWNDDASVNDNVLFTVNGSSTAYGKQTTGEFMFWRLKPKASAFTSETVLTEDTKLDAIFELDATNNNYVQLDLITVKMGIFTMSGLGINSVMGTSGVIRSREDEGLRSKCILAWANGETPEYGITSDLLLQAWKQGATALGDSDLILEGGGDF